MDWVHARPGEVDLEKYNVLFEIRLAVHRMSASDQLRLRRLDSYSDGNLAAIAVQVPPQKLFALEQEVATASQHHKRKTGEAGASQGAGCSASRRRSESCFCCCPVSAHLMAATSALCSHPAPDNHHAAPARMHDDARCCDSH